MLKLILSQPSTLEDAPDSMSIRLQELKDYAVDYERFSQVILEQYNQDRNDKNNGDKCYTIKFVDDCLQMVEALEKIARELFEIHQQDPITPFEVIIENIDVAISWYDLLLSDEFSEVAMNRSTVVTAKQKLMAFKQTLSNVLPEPYCATRPLSKRSY